MNTKNKTDRLDKLGLPKLAKVSPAPTPRAKRFKFRVPADLYVRIKRAAAERGIPMTRLVDRAVAAGLAEAK